MSSHYKKYKNYALQVIVVNVYPKHRCRLAQMSTTMLYIFNNDALLSKESIVVVKRDGLYILLFNQ